jgi:hypothetical protein
MARGYALCLVVRDRVAFGQVRPGADWQVLVMPKQKAAIP